MQSQEPTQTSSPLKPQRHLESFEQMQKLKLHLMSQVRLQKDFTPSDRSEKWLFELKLKHQILLGTLIMIVLATGMFILSSQIQLSIFRSFLSSGFNQILNRQNQNFQASVMLKYMSVTQNYFYNDRQILLALNQLYNHALSQEYSIDIQTQCQKLDFQGVSDSSSRIDSFCHAPDTKNSENVTLNPDFIKFQSTINQFILCFSFQYSFDKINFLQIDLKNEDEIGLFYPYNIIYKPSQKTFFILSKQQYKVNFDKPFQVSQQFKWINIQGGRLYGQALIISFSNGTQFPGVIATSVQSSIFDQILENFPDVNLALVASDGSLVYSQINFDAQKLHQYIYNQSQTGYNYLDWLSLLSNLDYQKQLIIYNALFSQPIKVNIKKFQHLPFYFLVYNNLTFESQIKTLQVEIISEMTQIEYKVVFSLLIKVISILIVCCFLIEKILTPTALKIKVIKQYTRYYRYITRGQKFNNSYNKQLSNY